MYQSVGYQPASRGRTPLAACGNVEVPPPFLWKSPHRGDGRIPAGQGWWRTCRQDLFACWGVSGSRVRGFGWGFGRFRGSWSRFWGCSAWLWGRLGALAVLTAGWGRVWFDGVGSVGGDGRGLVYGGALVGVVSAVCGCGVSGGVVSGPACSGRRAVMLSRFLRRRVRPVCLWSSPCWPDISTVSAFCLRQWDCALGRSPVGRETTEEKVLG